MQYSYYIQKVYRDTFGLTGTIDPNRILSALSVVIAPDGTVTPRGGRPTTEGSNTPRNPVHLSLNPSGI